MNNREIYKKMWRNIALVLIISIPFIILGTFYDFQITYTLSNVRLEHGEYVYKEPFWVKALELISEWPTLLFFAVAAIIIARNISVRVQNHVLKTVGCLAFYFADFLAVFRGWQTSFKDIFGEYNVKSEHYYFIIPLAIVTGLAILLLLRKISDDKLKGLFRPAVASVVLGITLFVGIEAIKIGWGRMRLRDMIALNDISGYQPWYLPNFFSGYKSFPSGHTSKAGALFTLLLWFPGEKYKKRRKQITCGLSAWSFLVCASRLFACAHFLTDLIIGWDITLIMLFVVFAVYNKAK